MSCSEYTNGKIYEDIFSYWNNLCLICFRFLPSKLSVSLRHICIFLRGVFLFCHHENCFSLVQMNILCLFNIDFQLKSRMIICGVENFFVVVTHMYDIPTFFYNIISILNIIFFSVGMAFNWQVITNCWGCYFP